MEVIDSIELIMKAIRKREERDLWELYLMRYQHMTKDNFISFEDFCRPTEVRRGPERRTKEEILAEVDDILSTFREVR